MALVGFSEVNHKTASLITISNLASGGSIGTAPATVDIATMIAVNQTTASQTLTLPAPSARTAGLVVPVVNTGSQAFTLYSRSVAANNIPSWFCWDGSNWH